MCMCQAYAVAPSRVADERGIERALEHAGELVSERVRDGVMDAMMDYIWKYTVDGVKTGICSSCKGTFPLPEDSVKLHRVAVDCPVCGREAVMMDAWRGRKTLQQQFYVAEWRKSAIDPEAVVLVGSVCSRDSSKEHPEHAITEIVPVALYVYKYGWGAVCYKRAAYAWDYESGGCKTGEWYRMRECRPGNSFGFCGGSLRVWTQNEWFQEAIRGTRFETMWEALMPDVGRWAYTDRTPEMESIAKRPYLEYLVKMGQLGLAREALGGHYPRGAINHKGKTAQAILGLDGQQLREVKRDKLQLNGQTLALNRWLKKCGIRWDVAKVMKATREIHDIRQLEEALRMVPQALREKAIKYAIAHIGQGNGPQNYYGRQRDLEDYWKQMVELKMDMSDEQLLLPKDLNEAHTRTTVRIKYLADKALEAKIEAFRGMLSVYEFEHGGLFMRPMKDAEEIVREGNALSHCVGGYARKYAMGETILCVLRRADAPEVPYRTVEFSTRDRKGATKPADGALMQCRGYKNTSPKEEQPEIDAFFKAFEVHRRRKAGRKTA